MCGCVSVRDLQDSVLISQEGVDDVLEAGTGEGIGMPALDHQVVDDPRAAGGRREAIATVNLLYDLGMILKDRQSYNSCKNAGEGSEVVCWTT